MLDVDAEAGAAGGAAAFFARAAFFRSSLSRFSFFCSNCCFRTVASLVSRSFWLVFACSARSSARTAEARWRSVSRKSFRGRGAPHPPLIRSFSPSVLGIATVLNPWLPPAPPFPHADAPDCCGAREWFCEVWRLCELPCC